MRDKPTNKLQNVILKISNNARQDTYIGQLLAQYTIVFQDLHYREKNEQIYYIQERMEIQQKMK